MLQVRGEIGRYVLSERLGSGGMGEVYRASLRGPLGFEREVALKVIREDLASSERFATLFLREGRLLASLHHRNIVQVYELDQQDGRLFMAMEYVRGISLRTLLATKEVLSWQAAAFIASEVAQALSAAHSIRAPGAPAGIIHGDLSPSNVVLGLDGSVKVLDFGLARPVGEKPSTSGFQGKMAYLPPESLTGGPLDPLVDVYALGVLLYQMLARRSPFQAGNDFELMHQVMHAAIAPPSRSGDDIPSAMDALVMRAMARDRHARVSSAAELAEALDEMVGGSFRNVDLARLVHRIAPAIAAAGAVAVRSASMEPPSHGSATGGRVTMVGQPAVTVATGGGRSKYAIVAALAVLLTTGGVWWVRKPELPVTDLRETETRTVVEVAPQPVPVVADAGTVLTPPVEATPPPSKQTAKRGTPRPRSKAVPKPAPTVNAQERPVAPGVLFDPYEPKRER